MQRSRGWSIKVFGHLVDEVLAVQSRDVVKVDGPQCGLMMRNYVSEKEIGEARAGWRCCCDKWSRSS